MRSLLSIFVLSHAASQSRCFAFVLPNGNTANIVPPRGNERRCPSARAMVVLGTATNPNFDSLEAWTTSLVMSMVIALGITGTTSAAAPPLSEQAHDVARGAKVFESNCASCHIGGQNVFAKGRTLQKEDLAKYIGLNDASVKAFVEDDLLHRGTFAFGHKVTDEELSAVSTFVVDQATGEKW